jgi:hypothetical protein
VVDGQAVARPGNCFSSVTAADLLYRLQDERVTASGTV